MIDKTLYLAQIVVNTNPGIANKIFYRLVRARNKLKAETKVKEHFATLTFLGKVEAVQILDTL